MKTNRGRFIGLLLLFVAIILPIKIYADQEVGAYNGNEISTRGSIPDNIFTEVKMYRTDGSEIGYNDELNNGDPIKIDFKFSFENKNYQAGDTFTTKIPDAVNIAKNIEGDFAPMTSAKWSVDASTNELTITFLEDNVTAEKYDLSIVTSLKRIVNDSDGNPSLVYTTSPQDTIYSFEIESSFTPVNSADIILDSNFNNRTGKITSIFNRNRLRDNERDYKVALNSSASIAKLNLLDVEVYTSKVNFNGVLEGEKTKLVEGVDYDLVFDKQGTSKAEVKVILKKDIDRNALIVNANINGIDGTSYITTDQTSVNYGNNIYGYAYTLKDDVSIAVASDYEYFFLGDPLRIQSKMIPETSEAEWTIYWNHNERDLTNTSVLESIITDMGLEYVPDSFEVIKVDPTYQSPKYIFTEVGDVTNEFNLDMSSNGSFKLTSKNTVQGAYVIKYKTKITDPAQRDIVNKVSDGTLTKEAAVTTKVNLLTKESADVDIYNQTMTWTITVNNDRVLLNNAHLDEFFLDYVESFTKLEAHKINIDGSKTLLNEGVDYTLSDFDKDGNPLNIKAGVRGAPENFNGGVRMNFIGDYAPLKDKIVISFTTKLDTKDVTTQTIDIKNSAVLYYYPIGGEEPPYVTYDAKGVYSNPYYNGGTKLVNKSSDEQYHYQNWLVAVNVNGNNYNKITMEDVIPDGLTLMPETLKYDEIISSEMLDKINNYIMTDNKLAVVGDDVYPTKVDTSNNTIKLEFDNIGNKRVLVKFKTKVAKEWYFDKYYTNKADISFDGSKYTFERQVNPYAYTPALTKSVSKDSKLDNVANWTVTTRNISEYLPVENPKIVDVLQHNGTNATYDPTSFVVRDIQTNEVISTANYDLKVDKESFEIQFKNYKATSNFKITYSTISEYSGRINNTSVISSESYGVLSESYRKASTNVILEFTSGSGSGVVKSGGFTIAKVDSIDNNLNLSGAVFEIYKLSGDATGLKATTDENGSATFDNIPYGEYLLKEIQAPQGYLISNEYKNGKKITVNSEVNEQLIKVENSLAPTPATVILKKIDKDSGKALQGAIFKLVKSDGSVVATNLKTNAAGEIKYENLLSGDYQFIETKAPKDYVLDKTPIKFTLIPGQITTTKLTFENISNKSDGNKKVDNDKLSKTGFTSADRIIILVATSILLNFILQRRKNKNI